MKDLSHLDQKYFIDRTVYNCPYCNRNNVKYSVVDTFRFDWTDEKKCYGFMAKCSSCLKVSMHLGYEEIVDIHGYFLIEDHVDIDSMLFYSVPTSFFVIDSRIPIVLRELITEADGSLKMNFLTGASACSRKAIYELTRIEDCAGDDYRAKIKSLKEKYENTDANLFDILAHIQGVTSDKVHEDSWPKWDAKRLKLIIETLKTVFFEIYVLPEIKSERARNVLLLYQEVNGKKTFEENNINSN